MNDIQRKVNEFCDIGNLENYRHILNEIFEIIQSKGCRIAARYDHGPSVHKFPNENEQCIIMIPIKRFAQNPIEIIWTILHELGHHTSGVVERIDLTDEVTLRREDEAWEYARNFLKNHDGLKAGIDEFNIYADRCLNSYKQRLALKKEST